MHGTGLVPNPWTEGQLVALANEGRDSFPECHEYEFSSSLTVARGADSFCGLTPDNWCLGEPSYCTSKTLTTSYVQMPCGIVYPARTAAEVLDVEPDSRADIRQRFPFRFQDEVALHPVPQRIMVPFATDHPLPTTSGQPPAWEDEPVGNYLHNQDLNQRTLLRRIWVRANLNAFAPFPTGIRQLRAFLRFAMEVAPLNEEYLHHVHVLRPLLWAPYWLFTKQHASSYACLWDAIHVICRHREEGLKNPRGHTVVLKARGGLPLRCL